jgi:DNA-binding NarL/FixJ family response regulator
MGSITIRIFASHPVAAGQYSRLLASERDFRLVADPEPFQVGLFDGEPTAAEGTITLARLKLPSMRPLVLISSCEENECLRWILRGVWGVVAYNRYEQDLTAAVRQVAAGQLCYPVSVVCRWMQIEAARRSQALSLPLTRREREIMEFLSRRLSNREIAGILGISERTVKFHVGNILSKLHVSSRWELSTASLPMWA